VKKLLYIPLFCDFNTENVKEYKGVSKSFWAGCLEQELEVVQLSGTRYSCIAIL
jgi:hypothetical protein